MVKKKTKSSESQSNKRDKLNTQPAKTKSRAKVFDIKNIIINIGLFLVIFFGTYLFYSSTIKYNLVHCDDDIFVLNYKQYNSNPENIINSFKRTIGTSFYRPVLQASFVIDYQLGDTDVGVYRRTNVFLHSLGASLLFVFFIVFGFERISSLLFCGLFALHPILTPSAAWISGRNDSLIAVFILSAFIFQMLYYKSNKFYIIPIFYVLHLLMFALSIFTKEIAIVFPFVSIIYSFYHRGDRLINPKNLSLGIGWIIIMIVWFIMRKIALSNVEIQDEIGLGALIKNLPSIAALIGKIFLPIQMIALSNYEMISIISGCLIILCFIIFLIFNKKVKFQNIVPGLSWFILFIAPTLLVRIVYVDDFFDYAEHRAYLPMIGIFLILIEIFRQYKVDFKKLLVLLISIIIIALFALRSKLYEPTFTNRFTFWSHHIDVYPDKARGYLDLGKAYYFKTDLDSAELLYKQGMERNPDNFNFYIDISAVYIRKQEYDKAIANAKKAIEMKADQPLAHYNLSRALAELGRYEEAIPNLENAIKIKRNPIWIIDLGMLYYQAKDYEKALEILNKATTIKPNDPHLYNNLGSAYAANKQFDEAEKVWLKTLSIEPDYYQSLENLLRLYLMKGQIDKAREYKNRIIRSGKQLPVGINIPD